MQNSTHGRRHFLKLASLAVVFGKVASFPQWAYAEARKLIDPTKTKRKDKENEESVAMLVNGMKYVEDAKKANPARTDKPHPAGGTFAAAKQYCMNCVLLESDSMVDDAKGPIACKMAAKVLVHNLGYCQTYGVHPKAKA